MGKPNKVVIVDLDSTLADTQHRHGLTPLANPGNTWEDYSLACGNDGLIESIKVLLDLLTENPATYIYILSARDAVAHHETETWLNQHGVIYDHLRLRSAHEESAPIDYKLRVIGEWMDESPDHEFVLFIDDYMDICKAVEAQYNIPTICPRPVYEATELGI